MATPNSRVVVLAVDSSEHGVNAFNFYKNNVEAVDDKLIVVHCHDIRTPELQPEVVENNLKELVADHEKSLQCLLDRYEKLISEVDKEWKLHAKIQIIGGKPGDAICKFAKKEEADMIVVGSRGLNALRRTFLGSVSDHVLHHAHCPVIIVKEGKK